MYLLAIASEFHILAVYNKSYSKSSSKKIPFEELSGVSATRKPTHPLFLPIGEPKCQRIKTRLILDKSYRCHRLRSNQMVHQFIGSRGIFLLNEKFIMLRDIKTICFSSDTNQVIFCTQKNVGTYRGTFSDRLWQCELRSKSHPHVKYEDLNFCHPVVVICRIFSVSLVLCSQI